jgi:hypothetical protein
VLLRVVDKLARVEHFIFSLPPSDTSSTFPAFLTSESKLHALKNLILLLVSTRILGQFSIISDRLPSKVICRSSSMGRTALRRSSGIRIRSLVELGTSIGRVLLVGLEKIEVCLANLTDGLVVSEDVDPPRGSIEIGFE